MLGYYNYTVILTYVGMLTSFCGLMLAFNGDVYHAIICLMLSGLCDMFDGKIASTKKNRTKAEKNFGIQIDSLSDLICFGVLPAVIINTSCPKHIFTSGACAIYLLCALIRLAFFNVDEIERQEQTDDARHIYFGLPVTSAALLIPFLFILKTIVSFPLKNIATVYLMLIAIAFVSPFELKKPAKKGKIIFSVIGLAELFYLLARGTL